MNNPLMPGRALRVIAWIGLLLLLAVLIHALRYGYGWSQLTAIGSIAWGQVLLVDVYVGIALFGAWIVWREGPGVAAALWVLALLALGNLVSCIYVLRALRQAHHAPERFWHGVRADRAHAAAPHDPSPPLG